MLNNITVAMLNNLTVAMLTVAMLAHPLACGGRAFIVGGAPPPGIYATTRVNNYTLQLSTATTRCD